jgi:hypothetical protein
MSAKQIRAGGAFWEITVRDKLAQGFRRAMSRVRAFAAGVKVIGSAIAGMGAAVVGIGAAVTAPLALAAKAFADTGSQLHDLAAQTGLSVEQLSELKFAAEQSGASLEDVANAIKMMQKNGFDARKFDEIAGAIAAIEDPTKRTQAALDTFGKGGAKLIPMLKELQALRAQARSSGLILSTEDAARADALGDAMDRLKSVFKALQVRIGAEFAGAFTEGIDIIAGGLIGITRLVQHLSTVIQVVGSAFAAVSPLATAAIGGILDALKGGDLLMAWNIIATTMQVVWNKTLLGIQTTTFNILDAILVKFKQAAVGLGAILATMEAGLQRIRGTFTDLGSNALMAGAGKIDVVRNAVGGVGEAVTGDTSGALAAALQELAKLRVEAAAIAEQTKKGNEAIVAEAEIAKPTKNAAATGTFNAAAAGLLGRAGTPLEREAKKTNQLLQGHGGKLDAIKDAVEEGGLAFT